MSVMKRRHFVRTALAALPAAAFPYGKLFAATDGAPPDDVEAVTGGGQQIILKGADVRDLGARMRGPLLRRESAGYKLARHA